MDGINIIFKINEIKKELKRIELKRRLDQDKAIEMDDEDYFVEIQRSIFQDIKKIKEWNKILDLLEEDVKNSTIVNEEISVQTNFLNADNYKQVAINDVTESGKKDENVEELNCFNNNQVHNVNKYKNDIRKIIILNKEFTIKNNYEALINLCEMMILKIPYVIIRFDEDMDLNEKGIMFSFNVSDFNNSRRLTNGLYVCEDISSDEARRQFDLIKDKYNIKVQEIENVKRG